MPSPSSAAQIRMNDPMIRLGKPVPRQNCDLPLNQSNRTVLGFAGFPCQTGSMLRLLRLLFVLTTRSLYSRRDLFLENLALRQQFSVLRKRHPRVRFSNSDRLFWTALLRLWSKWKRALVLVQPDTVVRWHRAGFKLYWKWISRHGARAGRRCVSREVKELIFRMVAENST